MSHKRWNPAGKVYIGNLSENTTTQDIEFSFRKYGPLNNIWIAHQSRHFAFVQFRDAGHAENAVRGLDRSVLCGNCVRVEMSVGRFKSPDGDSRRRYKNGYVGGGTDGRRKSGRKGYGWTYRNGNVAAYAFQGPNSYMEDRFVIHENFNDTGVSLFAIFDGHGGDFAVKYASKNLINSLKNRIIEIKTLVNEKVTAEEERPSSSKFEEVSIEKLKSYLDSDNAINFQSLLVDEVLRTDKLLIKAAEEIENVSGTTAFIAVIEKDQLTVANVGDSRGVMCDRKGNAVPLSFDHKPENRRERERIQKAGGCVTINGTVHRVGGLAMSRALGNYDLKNQNLVIADPHTKSFNLADLKPRFLIFASDGLWDVFTNNEAVAYVGDKLNNDDPFFGAKSITLQANRKGSKDNITVLIINLLNYNWGASKLDEI